MNISFNLPSAAPPFNPVAKSELNNDQTEACSLHHETVVTKPFRGRSVLPTQKVSADRLEMRLLFNELVNDDSYLVDEHVRLANCTGLKTLSGNISVKGDLFIHNCPDLQSISANLFVDGCLEISNCPLLERITGSVTVNDQLSICYAPSLADLPGIFSIRGSLFLMCCSRLRKLSGAFSVESSAFIDRCKRLRNLSGDFTVGGMLDLSHCNHLTNLSGTFCVGGNINLDYCTRLRFLPDWITTLGPDIKGRTRTVDLQFTGLSDTSVDRLHAAKMSGMRFLTTREQERQSSKVFDNLQEALAFWGDLASSNKDTPQLNLESDQAEVLLDFLEQLTWTQEYRNRKYKPVLARRVMQVITLVLMDDHLREEALIYLDEATVRPDEVIFLGLRALEKMLQGDSVQSELP